MTDTDLIALAKKVEGLTGPCARTWAEVHISLFGFPERAYASRNGMRRRGDPPIDRTEWAASHFGAGGTGYFDDAAHIVPVGPGIGWQVSSSGIAGIWRVSTDPNDYGGNRFPAPIWSVSGNAATPALALTAASLRAHAAHKEG